ncbi:hypothetical protein [Paenibacillus kribbensis]|uniref:hypothetical protein n=1 Tax=Paenibacillus kribbensis TaxID=172713 RepID=UPI0015BE57EF|nr:hypothetical protein [Paenibacillus kribbensis]
MNHKMKIKYRDFELELEGDRDFVEGKSVDISSLITMLIQRPATQIVESKHDQTQSFEPEIREVTNVSSDKKVTFQEFLKEKRFKNNNDLVLGTAFYIEMIDKVESFSAKDIDEYLRTAKYTPPKNISLSFTHNTQKAYIMPVKEKKNNQIAYQITRTGIDFIESYIPSDKNSTVNKTANKRSKEKNIDFEVLKYSTDELQLDKYIDITTLTRTEDRALVILKIYSVEFGIQAMSAEEITAVLKSKFSISVNDGQIGTALRRAKPKVDTIKEEGKLKYKLMLSGERHIKELMGQNDGNEN